MIMHHMIYICYHITEHLFVIYAAPTQVISTNKYSEECINLDPLSAPFWSRNFLSFLFLKYLIASSVRPCPRTRSRKSKYFYEIEPLAANLENTNLHSTGGDFIACLLTNITTGSRCRAWSSLQQAFEVFARAVLKTTQERTHRIFSMPCTSRSHFPFGSYFDAPCSSTKNLAVLY